jgi:hypothetical protein
LLFAGDGRGGARNRLGGGLLLASFAFFATGAGFEGAGPDFGFGVDFDFLGGDARYFGALR